MATHRTPMPDPRAPHASIPRPRERRSRSVFNRCRRFLNNYWLVPVVVVYLQLLAAMMSVHGTGETGLLARNRSFLQGIPLSVRILSYDFPHAVVGHAKELLYHLGDGATAVPPMVVADGLRAERQDVYQALWASRSRHDTEVGGVVTVDGDGHVVLHPVPSSNGAFVRQLKELSRPEAEARLRDPANRPLVDALAGGMGTVQRILKVVDDPKVPVNVRERAFSSFLYSLEVTSESRFMLLPMAFKADLGRLPGWHYLGLYHFHNELDSPPSDADVASSDQVRQFVITLAPDGFDLYDIYQRRVTVSHHAVGPDAPGPGPSGTTRI
jgi:hypothetical protein